MLAASDFIVNGVKTILWTLALATCELQEVLCGLIVKTARTSLQEHWDARTSLLCKDFTMMITCFDNNTIVNFDCLRVLVPQECMFFGARTSCACIIFGLYYIYILSFR